jgi:diguanylate cyclase (GGDEF)-like protein
MVSPKRTWPRRFAYALVAAALSLGAPAGLLLVRAAAAGLPSLAWARAELAANAAVFLYVTVSTLVVFLLFGYVVGRQADRLLDLSESDALTGLRNARVLEERLRDETARARRYRHPLSLLFIDVDGLKLINDRGGHGAGDAALGRVAAALRDAARSTDVAARWGGDEFALLAPETPLDAAAALGERIRTLARRPGPDPMTVSVGVATTVGGPGANPQRLRDAADAALYAAKGQGRDRVVAASADDSPP